MKGTDKLFLQCNESIEFYTKHLNRLRKQVEMVEKAKRIIRKGSPKADLKELSEIENLNNYNGYLTISYLDLAVNLKNLIVAKTDWEKIFFIKNSYLIIHETLNRLKPSKEEFLIEKSITKDYPSLSTKLEELKSDIQKFRKTAEYKKIELTRHQTAGHITDSLKRYYDRVSDLDGEIAGKNIVDFMKISQKAINLTKDYAVLAKVQTGEKNKEIENKLQEMKDLVEKITVANNE